MRVLRFVLGTIVGLVLLVTLASLAYNLVTSDPNRPVTQLWHGKFVRTDGYLTAYREWGSAGKPVVLIGGFLEPTFVWAKVGPLLARRFHVYALDLDGFGYTERHGPGTLAHWATRFRRSCEPAASNARSWSATRSVRQSRSRRRGGASPRESSWSTATRSRAAARPASSARR